jgi:hypothetical protein
MTIDASTPALSSLEYVSYLDEQGQIPCQFAEKVGVYAIFDSTKTLQYIGYSRDVALSLKQHLVRQPDRCHWLKVQTIDRPDRTLLENIRAAWITENGSQPPGNTTAAAQWNQAIDVRSHLTAEEQAQYAAADEQTQTKLLKQAARRAEAQVLAALVDRGVHMPIRFNPKLKEMGLLDLK